MMSPTRDRSSGQYFSSEYFPFRSKASLLTLENWPYSYHPLGLSSKIEIALLVSVQIGLGNLCLNSSLYVGSADSTFFKFLLFKIHTFHALDPTYESVKVTLVYMHCRLFFGSA